MATRPRLYVLLYASDQHNFGLGHLELPLGPSRGQKLSVLCAQSPFREQEKLTVWTWIVLCQSARVLNDNFRHRYFTRVGVTGAWISPSCLQTSPNQCQMQIFSSFSFAKIKLQINQCNNSISFKKCGQHFERFPLPCHQVMICL